jgi:hypothetical protein
MAAPPITGEQARAAIAAVERFGTISDAARHLGIARASLYNQIDRAAAIYGLAPGKVTEEPAPAPFTTPELPSSDMPLDELLARRRSESERTIKAAEARELIPVHIRTPGPIGLLIVGDPPH